MVCWQLTEDNIVSEDKLWKVELLVYADPEVDGDQVVSFIQEHTENEICIQVMEGTATEQEEQA